MPSTKPYKSKQAAIENVKAFFANSPEEDAVTLEEAFRAWGRPNPEDIEGHKGWLSNKLTALKYHNLITPIYSYSNGRRKLSHLQLTIEGKRALGRLNGHYEESSAGKPPLKNNENVITLVEVMIAIPRIRKENPDFDINFSVTPKVEKRNNTE